MTIAPSLHLMVDPRLVIDKAGIKPGMRVADLGCGSHGTFVFAAADRVGDAGLVYAVDVQPSVLAAIKSKKEIWPSGTRVELIWADIEKHSATTIAPASVDVVMLINTLHQSARQVRMVEEAVQLVKPGGTLLVIDWATAEPRFAPQNQYPVDFDRIAETAGQLGLTLVDKFSASRYHKGLRFINPS